MNVHQVSAINLNPDLVDCIVFWSKNPQPMIARLHEISEYAFYFQFTLNPYNRAIEVNLPPKNTLIDTFKKLSDSIGPQRVIWRYDPILLNSSYNSAYHIDTFAEMAGMLNGYTEQVVISFIDCYKKIAQNIKPFAIGEMATEDKNDIAGAFSKIAQAHNLSISTCAEDIDLSHYGITHARCIDTQLISKITGYRYKTEKDKNQRLACGCAKSIDIGEYDSCTNGCIYCYAHNGRNNVDKNIKKHILSSPLLIGTIGPDDIISERKAASDKMTQNEFF